VYGLAAVDDRGRVADYAIVQALGWRPGTRLDIRVARGWIVVMVSDEGAFSVTNRGHVRLPATARRCCGVMPGDRVLLVADPANGSLVVHPPAVIDSMLTTWLQAGHVAADSP
jgi:bifunctional DNA-binding transcriptional regulator/antitoxin component of YhaV-PrlF toxin-antitoxin module